MGGGSCGAMEPLVMTTIAVLQADSVRLVPLLIFIAGLYMHTGTYLAAERTFSHTFSALKVKTS